MRKITKILTVLLLFISSFVIIAAAAGPPIKPTTTIPQKDIWYFAGESNLFAKSLNIDGYFVLNGVQYTNLASDSSFATNAGYATNSGYATNAGSSLNGGWRNPLGFNYITITYPRGLPDNLSYTTNQDVVFEMYNRSVSQYDTLFQPTITHQDSYTSTVSYTSWPTNIAYFNGALLVQVDDGSVTCSVASTAGGCAYTQTISLVETYNTSSTNIYGGAIGSVRSNIIAAIDSLLTNAAPSSNVFTSVDNINHVYVRNTNCWAYSLDDTPLAVYYSSAGPTDRMKMGVTLISPRHIVTASHNRTLWGGTKVYFVKKDNTVVERTVMARPNGDQNPFERVLDSQPGVYAVTNNGSDMDISLLDSDVPAGISFCRMLTNDIDYLPKIVWPNGTSNETYLTEEYLPMLFVDQFWRAQCWDTIGIWQGGYWWIQLPTGPIYYCPYLWMIEGRSQNINRQPVWYNVDVGDSGHASLMFINNIPVLIGTKTTQSGSCNAGWNIDGINAAMTRLNVGVSPSCSYQATVIDLSSFTTNFP